jgi:diguanylate cyclase (GGDEF)-like protein/PAS domain S-box-containing protein
MHRDLRSFVSDNLVSLAVFLAGMMVLVFGLVLTQQAWQDHRQLKRLEQAGETIDALLQAIDAQARERGLVGVALGQPTSTDLDARVASLHEEVTESWQQVFQRLTPLYRWEPPHSPLQRRERALRNALTALDRLRGEVLARSPGEIDEADAQRWFVAATRVNAAAGTLRLQLMLDAGQDRELLMLNFATVHNVARGLEFGGQVRGLLSYYVAAGQPMPPDRLAQARAAHELSRVYRAELAESAAELTAHPLLSRAFDDWLESSEALRSLTGSVFEAAIDGSYPVDGQEWFEQTSIAIEAAFELARAAANHAREQIHDGARRSLAGLALYFSLALLAGVAAMASLRRVRFQARQVFAHKALSEAILESVADAVVSTDAAGNIRYLNPVAEELIGCTQDEARGRHYSEIMRIFNRINTSQIDPLGFTLEHGLIMVLTEGHVLVNRRAEEILIEDSCAPILTAEGEVAGAVIIFSSKDRTRESPRILTYHATHDALTGLGNRRSFEQRADELIRDAHDTGTSHALAFIDLDNFRVINDVGGYAAGDKLLQQVVSLIRKNIRECDLATRLGGDEFALLLRDATADQAEQEVLKLIDAVSQLRFPWNGHVFTTGMSVGIVEITSNSPDMDRLLQDADAACYAAKEQGRNHVVIHRPEADSGNGLYRQACWVPRLNQALEENHFELHGQEIRPLHDGLTPRMELLLRMRKDGELVPPGAFIPAAERHGLMPEVDRWVIEQACRSLTPLLADRPDFQYSINLSGVTLSDPDIADFIISTARKYKVDPANVRFEITETAAMTSLDRALAIMHRLIEEGFAFALDDFGSGLSSLSSLRQLPITMVKIDGSFITRLTCDPVARAMVEAIVSIARLMGIRTCAEYVEDEATVALLKELGVDYGQGFHFGRPRPLADSGVLEQTLRARTKPCEH